VCSDLQALDVINTAFPRGLKPYIESFLDSSLAHLKGVFPAYENYYINATESVPGSSEDEAVEIPYLICPMFDLVSNIVRGGRAKQWFDPKNQSKNLTDLVGVVFRFAQMTAEDVRTSHLFSIGISVDGTRRKTLG
jgi:hypothetical protein